MQDDGETSLEALGWGPALDGELAALGRPDLEPARVIRADRGALRLIGVRGQTPARLSGRLLATAQSGADRPVVGDWVAAAYPDGDGEAAVHHVFERQSKFSRKAAGKTTDEQVLAANIDTVFLVTGLDADFNLRRIERYLALVWESGARPVILLNKTDLCPDLDAFLLEVDTVSVGVPVRAVSAASGEGLDGLQEFMGRGSTLALLGSSGVGKSTLVNRLLGRDEMVTAPVRERDGRGQHTTSHRELFRLADGTLLIDTPGLRELQVWGSDDALPEVFAEIGALAESCRFSDCSHETEPGCAVREALERGDLDPARYQSYLKLQKEYDYLELRQDEHRRRARDREFGRLVKSVKKDRRRRGRDG